jgi:hypothetical protein
VAIVVQVKQPVPEGEAPVVRRYRLDPGYDSVFFVQNLVEFCLGSSLLVTLEGGEDADIPLPHGCTVSILDDLLLNGGRR